MNEKEIDRLLILGPDDGETFWVGGHKIRILAGAADTDGHYGLIVSRPSAGSSPPLHIHHGVDEAVFVVSGQVRFRCGDRDFTVDPGSFVLLPRDAPHTFSSPAIRTRCSSVCSRRAKASATSLMSASPATGPRLRPGRPTPRRFAGPTSGGPLSLSWGRRSAQTEVSSSGWLSSWSALQSPEGYFYLPRSCHLIACDSSSATFRRSPVGDRAGRSACGHGPSVSAVTDQA
jgi:mannose-6-phosphate isomerase-like protein (cupin superfamily)